MSASVSNVVSAVLRTATPEESSSLQPVHSSFYQKMVCSASIPFNADFLPALSAAIESDPYTGPFESYWTKNTWYMVKIPEAMRAIFQHDKNDSSEEGFFYINTTKIVGLLNEVFPEYRLTNNDLILQCEAVHHDKFRNLITKHLTYESLLEQADDISSLAKNFLRACEMKAKSMMLSSLSTYSASVICIVLLGYKGPFEDIALAMDQFNDTLTRKYLGFGAKDPAEYEKAKATIRQVILSTMNSDHSTPFVKELKESGQLTEQQQAVMILILFFAGQENVSAALGYMIWRLAMDEGLQQRIFADIDSEKYSEAHKKVANCTTIQKVVKLGLIQHPPIFSIARLAKRPLVLEFTHENGEKTQRLIPKDNQINPCPFFAGRDIAPKDRFSIDDIRLGDSNLPFGYGPRQCPGQRLAEIEIRLFLAALVRNYTFTTDVSLDQVDQMGKVTLKLTKDISISIKSR